MPQRSTPPTTLKKQMKRSELASLLASCGAEYPDAEARMCFDALSPSPLPPLPDPDGADAGIADEALVSAQIFDKGVNL